MQSGEIRLACKSSHTKRRLLIGASLTKSGEGARIFLFSWLMMSPMWRLCSASSSGATSAIGDRKKAPTFIF